MIIRSLICLLRFLLVQHQLLLPISAMATGKVVTTSLNSGSSTTLLTSITLPIFPLRKSVKLPTDEISLNLYEERYLALADHVLYGNKRISTHSTLTMMFGAWYCSNKSQIVRNSTITPIIDTGDVGVICHVVCHKDDSVTIVKDESVSKRRRQVNIVGLAVDRFRVEKVLFNGFDSVNVCPYIVVEAVRFCDVSNTNEFYLNRLEWYEKTMCEGWNSSGRIGSSTSVPIRSLQRIMKQSISVSLCSFEDIRARASQTSSVFEKLVLGDDRHSLSTIVRRNATSREENKVLLCSKQQQQKYHEFLSFSMISALVLSTSLNNGESTITLLQAEELLKITCPLERYKRVGELLLRRQRGKKKMESILLPFSIVILLAMDQLIFLISNTT
jgi:hypothetical protein